MIYLLGMIVVAVVCGLVIFCSPDDTDPNIPPPGLF